MFNRSSVFYTTFTLLWAISSTEEVVKLPCKYDYTVYVYPLSPELSSLKLAEEARRNHTYHVCRKCIFEQFALEYVLFDFFTQFCGRTYNPEEADYFYLPIVRDIDYRVAMSSGNKRDPSATENVLLEAIEKKNLAPWNNYLNVTDQYWKRNGGADHIIAMPAPVTNLRHQASMRGFFHYMIQLEAPIFLNVEFSRSFVQEYPICAKEKNIVMPYPSIDPELLRGNLVPSMMKQISLSEERKGTEPTAPRIHFRDKLIYYQGGRHGSCEAVRNALAKLMVESNAATKRPGRREEAFKRAKFCPIPIGDSPSSKRMYDVMHHGCVPVVLSDDLVWAYSTDTGGSIDPRSFSIQLPQKTAQRTVPQLLLEVTEADMPTLPSGLSLYALLLDAHRAQNRTMNSTDSSNPPSSVPLSTGPSLMERSAALLSWTLAGAGAGKRAVEGAGAGKRRLKGRGTRRGAGAGAGAGTSAAGVSAGVWGGNALVQILQRIPLGDLEELQRGVERASSSFRYYQYNSSLQLNDKDIPTSRHTFPDGRAIEELSQMLSIKKKKGIIVTSAACQTERLSPGHKYIRSYPCDKDIDVHKKKGKSKTHH